MAAGLILEFQGVDRSDYDKVNAALGIDMQRGTGDWPAGLQSHAAGSVEGGGFCVLEVWESKGHQERFMQERLAAALQSGGLPQPSRMAWVDLVAYHTPS